VTLPTPVNIAANTTYVTSYHTTGSYVATNNGFTTAITNGPLTGLANSTPGGNGVYSYGGSATAGIFPTNSYSASNYYADVVFVSSTTPNSAPTAVNDTATATEKGGTNNSDPAAPATGNVLTNDTDPDGASDTKTVTAVSFNGTNGTLGTPLAGAFGSLSLGSTGAFTYTVNETNTTVQALAPGQSVIDTFSYTMRDTAGATSSATIAVTVRGANDAPVLAVPTGSQSAVVGQPFTFALPAGTFTDVDGGPLTFTATTIPAWLSFVPSTQTFTGTPNTVGTQGVVVTASDGALTATDPFNIVVAATPNAAPTAVADAAQATEKGGVNNSDPASPATGNVLTNDTDPDGASDTKTVTAVRFNTTNGTVGSALVGAHGSLTLNPNGTFTYTVNETDSAVQALRQLTDTTTDVFNYTMRDTAGATSSANLTITIRGANDAPTLSAQTANQNAVIGQAFSLQLPTNTFTDVDAGDGLTYSATTSTGTQLPTWLSFNPTTRTFSGTPPTGSAGTQGIRVTATDTAGATATETFNIGVAASAPVSLFSTQTPANLNTNDTNPVELGVRFTTSAAGTVTAIKFYKSSQDTGTHTGSLWSSAGTRLATVTFTNETASGWQTATFSSPVQLTAGQTYTASYHTNVGRYANTGNFFTAATTSGPLTAPATTNGVYAYGSNSAFPTNTYNRTNYWVDVVFNPGASA
jgi:VCBS repeat-containing protein